ncbi:MAG: PD40 domain-containing protein [Saprospiraceae bacterium]|nr:PD40 domain-containing protein [Saprospiraceae bacterium]
MRLLLCCLLFILNGIISPSYGQETRLLRQPDISKDHIAFVYGSDIWVANRDGSDVQRITSTPAVESNPHFSPDGKTLAFSSNRDGGYAVYTVSIEGGNPDRLTWHPSSATVRGWTPDGKHILYATPRGTAPSSHNKLWTVPREGGPSTRISAQWGFDGSLSPDGKQVALDRMTRWEDEFRNYRGGQNTPLIILNLEDQSEVLVPNESTIDIHPTWLGDEVFFLSDRDWIMNVWAYNLADQSLRQVTEFEETDVKWINTNGTDLIIEQDGYLYIVDRQDGSLNKLSITVKGDFPWAAAHWEDVTYSASSVSLSPTGKRVVLQARGDIFTVPVEYGDPRNLTQSSDAADRRPIWSPNGDKVAWFSDQDGEEYALYIAPQDGMGESTRIDIGVSVLGWTPAWSPDGSYLAFVDDDVRIRLIDMNDYSIKTIDAGNSNIDRSRTGLSWAPDSKKLAYVKSGDNQMHRIWIWDMNTQQTQPLTDAFADAYSPTWDRDGVHFYFRASTDLALGAGWANTSSMQADPGYVPYVIVLQEGTASPFIPRSDEEEVKKEEKPTTEDEQKKENTKKEAKADKKKTDKAEEAEEAEEDTGIQIDYNRIARRTMALPVTPGNYVALEAGPKGTLFLAERKPGSFGVTLHKFTLKDRKAKEFMANVRQFSVSADGKSILIQSGPSWSVAKTGGPSGKGGKRIQVDLRMKLDPMVEWKQIFAEAWRYERDYFYDPNLHGRDWDQVFTRYEPLVSHVRHRDDLQYILDMMNGELSVGHSFVSGGDYPETERSRVGLLGADLRAKAGRWQVERIYTTESWNPRLSSPLDRPGMKMQDGYYIVGINGTELTAAMNPFQLLDGTLGRQTVIHINDKPDFEGHWTETVEPIRSENALRQRAWVEDNRRKVDSLSNGRLAYVWVPNTGGGGMVSFNRYFFAQQDKEGAVIDERFNGGGLLDDYMVDLMPRTLRAGLTNEVPNGKAFRLPAGILGPKVLLINERAGSGGDFFPWVFRQQQAGQLIGARTWGGLVKSSTHYLMVDGGRVTAPDNAVFDPINNEYVAENIGVAPDIPVRQDAQALSVGRDPQLERAVEEVLRLLENTPKQEVVPPPFNTPAKKKE